MSKKKIAVFASGNGTNSEKIFEYFQGHKSVKVALLLCNKTNAGVLTRAEQYQIKAKTFSRQEFYDTTSILQVLADSEIDYIALAGFMWLVPEYLVKAFPNKILNIHPALLPKFGGKGMYGMNVHRAVKNAEDLETGITIHFVNQLYDDGNIIDQFSCKVEANDTVEEIARKVQVLEHENYPKVIENVVLNKF